MAQLGRALRSGRRGRRFESCRIDNKDGTPKGVPFFIIDIIRYDPRPLMERTQLREGPEGPARPVDVRIGRTGAKRRPQVRILSHRYKKDCRKAVLIFFILLGFNFMVFRAKI